MGGPVEFNLLHCLGGMSLAIGSGFFLDFVFRRPRKSSVTSVSTDEPKVAESLAA